MKVGIFYSSIDHIHKAPNKTAVMDAFANGARVNGDEIVEIRNRDTIPNVDIGFVLGYTLANNYRRSVIDTLSNRGSRLVFVDSNIFSYKIKNVDYHRYSIDTVYPSTGHYLFNQDLDLNKWPIISKYHKVNLKPWRTSGNHILVLSQRTLSWNMLGKNGNEWTIDIVKKIKNYTDRPIIVRLHPGDTRYNEINAKNIEREFGNSINVSSNLKIEDDLKDAWCSVGYNSTPNCVSAFEGVPVYVEDPINSWASDVSFDNLELIENPPTPDREDWIHKLSNIHWSNEEVNNGKLFKLIKEYISVSRR
jgi:hypothetical protein